jgi:excinuclease ABC subunit A
MTMAAAEVLLRAFQRLVAAGHSVLVIEHNLDVIKSPDWVFDMAPEGGEEGGKIVAHATPENVTASPQSQNRPCFGQRTPPKTPQ